MFGSNSFCAVVVLLGTIGSFGICVARAETPADQSVAEGVLLLHNGGVLQGRIVLVGSRYQVTGRQSQVDVAAGQVAMVCESLAAAYDEQRRRLPRETAEGHLALADWCLRYELIEQAACELADARRLDPRHPRLELLERRLSVLTAPKHSVAVGAGDSMSPAPSPPEDGHEFDSLADTLPEGVVERFTRKIQPLLVNNCTTAACHQRGGSQSFQLDRAVLRGLSNRRTTLGNLSATLALVNRDAPERSPLLAIPTSPHGGRKGPLFGPRQDEHLQMLADWIALVTGSTGNEATTPLAHDGRVPPTPGRHDEHVQPNALPTPAALLLATYAEQESLRPALPPQHGAKLTPWRPKDEFDPEIFNRQARRTDDGR